MDWRGENFSWLTVQLNPLESQEPIEVKTLRDFCLEKLVSDVCLFRNLTGIPQYIHSLLLLKAIAQNRTLSITQLMKYCPYKDFKLPLPHSLKCWESLVKPDIAVHGIDINMRNAITMLSTFVCLMEENYNTSLLETLDLGIIPWCKVELKYFYEFAEKMHEKKEKLHKAYTLKSAFSITENDADSLLKLMIAAEAVGLKLVVTGLFCQNSGFIEDTMLQIISRLDPSELLHFSINYAKIHPSPLQFFAELQKFKNLKYFNLSYQASDFSQEPLLGALASTLHELPQLSHLILQGNQLRRCMDFIFHKNCKKRHGPKKKFRSENNQCCVVHNGVLEYLDISSCGLSSEDILFLREMPVDNNLKYLNVSSNSFNGTSAFQTLLTLKSSLIILEMEDTFSGNPASVYSADLFPFSAFPKLKFLNMRGLYLKQTENFPQFAAEKKKVPNLVIRREELDHPPEQRLDFGIFQLPNELFFLTPDDVM